MASLLVAYRVVIIPRRRGVGSWRRLEKTHVVVLDGEDAILPEIQDPSTLSPLETLSEGHLWGEDVYALHPSDALVLVLDISQHLPHGGFHCGT
jgi:hypothetical protein